MDGERVERVLGQQRGLRAGTANVGLPTGKGELHDAEGLLDLIHRQSGRVRERVHVLLA